MIACIRSLSLHMLLLLLMDQAAAQGEASPAGLQTAAGHCMHPAACPAAARTQRTGTCSGGWCALQVEVCQYVDAITWAGLRHFGLQLRLCRHKQYVVLRRCWALRDAVVCSGLHVSSVRLHDQDEGHLEGPREWITRFWHACLAEHGMPCRSGCSACSTALEGRCSSERAPRSA